MKKIIFKIVAIGVLTYFVFQIIYFLGFAFLYSYGAGGPEKIEGYEFKTTVENLKKDMKIICDKSKYLSYKDTLENDVYEKTLITIEITNENKKTVYSLQLWNMADEKIDDTSFYLFYINNKTNDDLGWFSWQKYKEVKLFEESIIEPLSKKYERIESP